MAVLSTTEEPDSAVMAGLGRGEPEKERRKEEGYIKFKTGPGFNFNKRCGPTTTVTHSLLDQWFSIAMLHNHESDYCYNDDCYGNDEDNDHNSCNNRSSVRAVAGTAVRCETLSLTER